MVMTTVKPSKEAVAVLKSAKLTQYLAFNYTNRKLSRGICFSITSGARSQQNFQLGEDICDVITASLGKNVYVDEWLQTVHGIWPTHQQLHTYRMAWLDQLIELYTPKE